MDYFSVLRLREFRDAAMSAGVGSPDKRPLLLAGIDRTISGSLTVISGPREQLQSDLVALNGIERIMDGTVPIQIWLDNARDLATPRSEAALFDAALKEVAERTEVRSPVPPVALAVDRDKKIELTPEEIEVPVWFLQKGIEAAKSVAKLLVRRYDAGLAATTASGEPLMFTATAWLLTPDLLITNHHVINARPKDEPQSNRFDLALQTEHSVAQFDFDADGDEGVKTPILSLEGFDPELDYAILRIAGQINRRGLGMARERLKSNGPLNLIHHAYGRRKTISLRNQMMSATETELRFFFDAFGSSGAPMFDDGWRVVALYKGKVAVQNVQFEGRAKAFVGIGTHITAILEHIKSHHAPLWQEIEHGILRD